MAVVLENYTRKCKLTQGKIKRAYLFTYEKYSRAQIRDNGMNLTEFPTSLIYLFECEGNFTQNSQSEQGSYFFDQSLTLQLIQVYGVLNIHDFLKTDYRIIVETFNDQLLLFGTRNGLTATTTNASGSNKNEFNGFTLNFTGKEEKSALLISDLSSLGFTVYDPLAFLNYDLNFDLS